MIRILLPKDKKGEFLIRNWVVAFLMFTGIFALLAVSSGSVLEKYDKTDYIDDDYRDNYDQFSNISEDYRGLFSEMTDGSSGVLEVVFGETGIFRGFFDLIKIVFNSVGMLDDITTQFMEDFGVPEGISNIVFPLISAIVIILLIFSIISSVNRGAKI